MLGCMTAHLKHCRAFLAGTVVLVFFFLLFFSNLLHVSRGENPLTQNTRRDRKTQKHKQKSNKQRKEKKENLAILSRRHFFFRRNTNKIFFFLKIFHTKNWIKKYNSGLTKARSAGRHGENEYAYQGERGVKSRICDLRKKEIFFFFLW